MHRHEGLSNPDRTAAARRANHVGCARASGVRTSLPVVLARSSLRRWRIATSKTGRPRWVQPPTLLLERVLALCRRDDRHADRRVFEQVTGDRLRTALTRACTAAGVPAFSPHDLRHRRVSLMHLAGVPWARIGEQVGHDDITTTSRVYTHVVADERELDYEEVLTLG